MVDHGPPLFKSVVIDDRFFLFLSLQVHAHANSICFGVELGADHVLVESDGHDRSFKRYMRPLFFDAEDPSTHLSQLVVIGLYDLVITAVHGKKWILQSSENRLQHSFMKHVHGKYAKCG